MSILPGGRGRRRLTRRKERWGRLLHPEPLCLCRHSLAFHHAETYECQGSTYLKYHLGKPVYVACPCRGYTTPGGRL